MLLSKGKITEDLVDMLMKWRHSGFNVFCGSRIQPGEEKAMENLGTPRAGSDRDRTLPELDPPDQHSRDQYFGRSRAQYGRRPVRRGVGRRPAVALLGGAPGGRGPRGDGLPLDRRHKRLDRRATRGWRRRRCRPGGYRPSRYPSGTSGRAVRRCRG